MGKKQKAPRLVENISDDEDEEIDEDEAFNSDDERKYGSFFERKMPSRLEDSEEEEGSSDDSDEDDSAQGDGGQYMLDLLDKLDDSNNKHDKKSDDNKAALTMAHHVKESQFASSVVPKADLTLDTLMQGIQDTKGFGNVQKSMKKVAQGQATAAPVARIISDRAQRKVNYQDQSKEVSQWLEAVQENRQAETLDFRPKQRLELTRDGLVAKFTPTTDFEKQLHTALQEAGLQDEQAVLKAKEAALQDDLVANQITLEEYKKRRGQLAKMRALMFYHEQKRHHINKIKSKKYRRIRKKQRERQKDADVEAQLEDNPQLERELEEKEEMERMKERMTLAHKNTSKWAKRILKRGKNVDVDTRRALSAQLKRGDDLLKRMNHAREDDEGDSDEDLVESAKKVLADTEQSDEAIQGEGLFKLSFMQRGIKRQRERAREEARQLLLELEESERIENGSDDSENDNEKSETRRAKDGKVASKEEMKNVLKEGEIVASSLKFGKSNTTQVSGGISVDVDVSLSGPKSMETSVLTSATTSEHNSTLEASAATSVGTSSIAATAAESTSPKKKKRKKSKAAVVTSNSEEESNPWLVSCETEATTTTTAKETTASTTKQETKQRRNKRKVNVNVERAVDLLSSRDDSKPKDETKDKTDSQSLSRITTLTQEELVRRAFAASQKDAEEDFAREKEQVAEQEDPSRKKRRTNNDQKDGRNLGWGCWTGKGAPPPPAKKKLPKPPPPKLPTRKRQDQVRPNIIIRERRLKRLAEFMVPEIPYPYTSREEYERAMSGAVGREWNVTSSFKDMTRPEVVTRAGKVIQPLSQKVKPPRPAAKF